MAYRFKIGKSKISCNFFDDEGDAQVGTDVYVDGNYAGEILNLDVPLTPSPAFEEKVKNYLANLIKIEKCQNTKNTTESQTA